MSIPKQLLSSILTDPFYEKCIRHQEKQCSGRVTFEHVWIYAGRQIQELWAIVPLCTLHHAVNEYQEGGDLRKEIGQHVSLQRASDKDLEKYPKTDWKQKRKYLESKYANIYHTFVKQYGGEKIKFVHIPEQQEVGIDREIHGHFHNNGPRSVENNVRSLYNDTFHKKLAIEETNLCPVTLDSFLYGKTH